jgi:CxxC-x17-CxxC domain-containing protein
VLFSQQDNELSTPNPDQETPIENDAPQQSNPQPPQDTAGSIEEIPATEVTGETEESPFSDKVINCQECGAEFVHSVSAQTFYREKGFVNEPKRCPACRKARKSSSKFAGRGGSPKEMHDATCAQCGKETKVPFKPTGSRPVYCTDCFKSQKR